MSQTARALRATSDALLRDLDALAALELEKRQLDPDDPRLVRLAAAIEEIAVRVLGSSQGQVELTRRAVSLARTGDPAAPIVSIEETPRDMATILAEWREAERQAADAAAGSPEALAVSERIERLRREYREAHESINRRRD